ncbi:cell differentiation protein Rcd1 [Capsaspora owczarzaki ATCC 30864]|uniref:Cell differentiation protein Rcd1 n=1 Tax=Capsaspora owczarzaki (strain ATCC 30864) TaxID=595528 RepID=A0A0D2X3B2_CAPO3|nr:cell differentiation protein Rcd1 [Capsaspora owczarzaki ATCC 30864]KJE94004.1 cell differentiation protein Rcd1 [Capsaspora owczarzaki ATCC 30864]|eukprot:XP_004347454.2 cell differentiation protein Rcd1 [Capsaspora owczarzaki ATCC 30864]
MFHLQGQGQQGGQQQGGQQTQAAQSGAGVVGPIVPPQQQQGQQQQQQQAGSGAVSAAGAAAGSNAVGNPLLMGMAGPAYGLPTTAPAGGFGEKDAMNMLVLELINPDQRENALLELSKKREMFPDLAPVLWHSFGTMAILIQEIVSVYPLLMPPALTASTSNRVCNALALLQCVASHAETRALFLTAHIPFFLYPFLNTVSKGRAFDYLRLTSLGVIGALVKTDDSDVIQFLLTTEIIPLCLRIMEQGTELSKTVATFIVQKILLDDIGLQYICQTPDRFFHVATILGKMVHGLVKEPSGRLIKHVVRCYLRLSENPRAREALRQCLPEPLRDNTFANVLKADPTTTRWLHQLIMTLADGMPQQ